MSPMWRGFWREKKILNKLLLPFSYLFRLLASARRVLLLCRQKKWKVPVIVVGNLSVGGGGKSPVVMYCAALLKAQGWRIGIVSRGYGGAKLIDPLFVTGSSDAAVVGDEPLMMARRLGCPVVVHPRRVCAVQALLEKTDCNVVLSDDGLQHYALHRDIEIVVIDTFEQLGNAYCLPAGPLREPPSRLKTVDFILSRESDPKDDRIFVQKRSIEKWVNVKDPSAVLPASAFTGVTVHALAGIAHPESFFDMCRALGIRTETHAYPDHAKYTRDQVYFADGFPVLMTEKDSVKCRDFVSDHTWYALLRVEIDTAFDRRLLSRLEDLSILRRGEA